MVEAWTQDSFFLPMYLPPHLPTSHLHPSVVKKSTSITQILISKHHSPLRGTRLLQKQQIPQLGAVEPKTNIELHTVPNLWKVNNGQTGEMFANKWGGKDEGRKSPFANISNNQFRRHLAMDAKTSREKFVEKQAMYRARKYLPTNY